MKSTASSCGSCIKRARCTTSARWAFRTACCLKPGRLSDHEFDIMKSHTLMGAHTLDAALAKYPTARFLQMARDIAMSHHERWDGLGYPQRLTGTDIPLAAGLWRWPTCTMH